MKIHLLRKRTTRPAARAALYADHLGIAWPSVHPSVQSAHQGDRPVRARGIFQIETGRHRLARLLVRLLRMPPPAQAIDTRLLVLPHRDGEFWIRRFGMRFVLTMQRAAPAGMLAEQFGPFEFRFAVEPDHGGLRYRQTSAALAWWKLRLPLPAFLAPKINGWEHPAPAPHHMRVRVEITFAPIGTILKYNGLIRQREART